MITLTTAIVFVLLGLGACALDYLINLRGRL